MRAVLRAGHALAAAMIGLLLATLVALTAIVLLRNDVEPRAVRATISLADALGGADTAGYTRAIEPRVFEFPEDHGPHPGFRTEWWYFTGNLEDERGRRFGYQLTFFRNALRPDVVARASAWAAEDVFMAHFALTDIDGADFHASERFERAALGLAGARIQPFRVWTGDWSAAAAALEPAAHPVSGRSAPFPLRLRAANSGVAIDLLLGPGKPPVLQGHAGLSRKGPEPGNASYYYSMTRLPTTGVVMVDNDAFRVVGHSWMDREWSTSSLSEGAVGWDWFALQLGDSTELMYYRLRDEDGAATTFSSGSFVDGNGEAATLGAEAVDIDVLETWASPLDGARYPSRWRLRVPSIDLDLEVRVAIADQELNLAVRYWEGAVVAVGTRAGEAVAGRGYIELTGYADARMP